MSVFGQAVNYYHDGVIAIASWYLSDKIHGNDLPVVVRGAVRHELSSQGGWVVLCVVTQVTAFHILCYIVAHPWPPEVVGYQVSGFPSA